VALGDFDGRWKNPQGNTAEALYLWAQDLIKELRKGEYISNSIASGISNAELADMAQSTIKGRAAGAGTGDPQDLTATQATAILNAFVGDSGSGGTKGLVPAPSPGDAAAAKFLKADGTWAAPAMVLLTSGSVSAVAQLDLVLTSYTAYRGIQIELANWIPVTDDVDLQMRFSTNGGSSYDAGATDYRFACFNAYSNATSNMLGSAGTTQMTVAGGSAAAKIGNGTAEGVSGRITILDQINTAIKTKFWANLTTYGSGDFAVHCASSGHRNTAQDTDAVRLFFSSGNISTGKYAVYGLN